MRDLEQNTVERGGSKNKRDEGVRARERDTRKGVRSIEREREMRA